MKNLSALFFAFFVFSSIGFAQPVIYANQVGFDARWAKIAVIGVDQPLSGNTTFSVLRTDNNEV